MGKLYQNFLVGSRIWLCSNCQSHLANHEEIVSKAFQGRHGKAYLFNKVVNVCLGKKEERIFITGRHTVCDIHCANCYVVLGWKYEEAFEDSQKYKVGKYILEKSLMMKDRNFGE